MRKALASAQLLADLFDTRWKNGIPVAEIKLALTQVKELSHLAAYLVDRDVLEPIAAASSRIQFDEQSRGLVMVIDVGAGTTDFGLSVVLCRDDDTMRAFQVEGTASAVRQAGNRLDDILGQVILEKAGVRAGDADFDRINATLRLRIRDYKERLFLVGEVTFRLENDAGGTVKLDDFLDRQEVKQSDVLREEFYRVLDKADRSLFDTLNRGGLTVILTGGGATMPMVQALALGQSQPHGIAIQHKQAELVPQFIENKYPELAREYLQLAVAIGGAMPDVMEEAGTLNAMSGTRRHWDLGGFRTEGPT